MQLRLKKVLKEELVASAYTVLTYVASGERVPSVGEPVIVTVPAPRVDDEGGARPAPRKRQRTTTTAAKDSKK